MLSVICDQFASYLAKRNLKEATIRYYLATVKQFLIFAREVLNWKETEKLECYHFRGYYLFLYLVGKEKPSTVEHKISILNSWQRSLASTLPDRFPFRGIVPSFDELRSLYVLPAEDDIFGLRNKLIILLSLCYGLTSTELTRIKLKHFDLGKKRLTLNQNCILETRVLPLIPDAITCLEQFKETMGPENYLLTNKKGQPLSWGGLRYILKKMLTAAGLPNYCPNELRRGWLKHLSSHTSIPTVLYLAGLGPKLLSTDYHSILAQWHNRLADGYPFFGVVD